MTLKRPKKTKKTIINLEEPTLKEFKEFLSTATAPRTEFPPSPWEIYYDPRYGTTDVSILYKKEVVGRIQYASVSFDTETCLPKLTLEILVPGLVIRPPQETPKV